ncbi:MAG: histidine kinase [Pseudomonadota bacterium]
MTTSHSSERTGNHPLELIPLFRRWAPSPARDLLFTLIWNTILALFLTTANMLFLRGRQDFGTTFVPTFVVTNCVGFLIHASLVGLDRLLRGWPGRAPALPRALYHIGLVGCCVMLGIVLGDALLRGRNPIAYLSQLGALAPLLPFALFTAIFMFVVILSSERRVAAETLAAQQSEQIANAAQLLAETRLRALQAQIEPHFLYNTLANVVGLIETEPTQARRMLERFIDYLRGTLAASRADQTTVGAEAELASAYLDVLAVRMGARLRYSIDIADDCRALPIAPMLLQPVLENAVTHGLEPMIDGGLIELRARCEGAQLVIEVGDTGAGLTSAPPRPGGGVGLSNLRARLRSLYHGAAQVQLIENQPCGITVRLRLPLKANPPSTSPAP